MNKRIYLSPPHMSGAEQEFVSEAFASNMIAPLGPQVDAFEQEFAALTGWKYCLALSSGTAAMHLALRHLGIGPGKEVLASDLTFIGSVSSAVLEGAGLVFIDCHPQTWNMDPDILRDELGRLAEKDRLPLAVIPTDLYGQCCDYDAIVDACQSYGVPVIVDAAESLGAKYRGRAGTVCAGKAGKAAVYSFNGNKIVTTSGGGMLASDDRELIDHARKLSQQAREAVPYYEHCELGFNYRMSNILAGIGRGQLQMLEERVARKRGIFEFYTGALADLPGISFMPEAEHNRCSRWLSVILVDKDKFGVGAEEIRQALEKENIESRPVWKPMHMQPLFQGNEFRARYVGRGDSKHFFEHGLCLPSGTQISSGDLKRIVQIIDSCRKSKKTV
jgi:dTDP-4-amino-4,6-dideoxygalactose transaminase